MKAAAEALGMNPDHGDLSRRSANGEAPARGVSHRDRAAAERARVHRGSIVEDALDPLPVGHVRLSVKARQLLPELLGEADK